MNISELSIISRLCLSAEQDSAKIDLASGSPQETVAIVMAISGIIECGGVLSIFENEWEPGFDPKNAPAAFDKICAFEFAEIIRRALCIFPAGAIDDIMLRRQWAWGKTPGSENSPEILDQLNSDLNNHAKRVELLCVAFIVEHINLFPATCNALRLHCKI